MNKIIKRAVAEMVATLGHVGMAVNTVPRLNEHVSDNAKRVHFNRWGYTVVIGALERSLRKIKNAFAAGSKANGCGIGSNVRWQTGVVDGEIADRPPFDNFCPPRSTRAKAQHACVLRPPERGGPGCQ